MPPSDHDTKPRKVVSMRPPSTASWLASGLGVLDWIRGRQAPDVLDSAQQQDAGFTTQDVRQPPLQQVESKLERAEARFEHDPAGAIAELLTLRRRFAPHALLLHALCLYLARVGREDEAMAVAREALPLLLRSRQGLLAAQIFDEINADADALGLDRPTLLALGGALRDTLHWPIAVKALGSLVMADPSDERAVEELLHIAERHLRGHAMPIEAWKIFQFLSLLCSSSRESERIDRGLETSRQRAGII